MALTDQQRQEVADMRRRGQLRSMERGRLEALRRFHSPTPSDADAIAVALGEKPSGRGELGARGRAEVERRFPGQATKDPSADFWADFDRRYADLAARQAARARAWAVEKYGPDILDGLPDPAA